MSIIKTFQIGSDDNDLTEESINNLRTVDTLPENCTELGQDEYNYYDEALRLGYRVFFAPNDIDVYLVKKPIAKIVIDQIDKKTA